MRTPFFAMLFIIACGDSKPTWPAEAPALDGLEHEQACAAVAPRAKPCLRNLLVAEMAKTMKIGVVDAEELYRQEAGTSAMSAKEADGIHRAMCAGHGHHAASVATCWQQPRCQEFAACVSADLAKYPPR